jgi:hypothetical protein
LKNDKNPDLMRVTELYYLFTYESLPLAVWTRDADGQYYLARVISGWEYWMTPETWEKDIDIGNVFRCDIRKIAIDAVPGKVVACFRASRTIQRIADSKAIEYTKQLWNETTKMGTYKVDSTKSKDVFMMLDDEETEDLIFLYLQSQGWYIVPNSRKGDTMRYEYLAVNPITGERALTQVKTGKVILNRDRYRESSCRVFLFQSNELYSGNEYTNITSISRSEVLSFLEKSTNWLPRAIFAKYWAATGVSKGVATEKHLEAV